jgi:three-Cys-motif partner protein
VIRTAQDGLPARLSGPWTREKLAYVEKYAAAFMKAMAPKRKAGKWTELIYMDLFAGPGRGLDRESHIEFEGSPLRALRITPAFDRLFFSDLSSRNIEALRHRVPAADLARVSLRVGDCHVVAKEVLPQLSNRTLGLAFVDPEGFEATFQLFRTLATRRIDALFLFPSGIGIARNLAAFARQTTSPMDELWGGREWRDLPPAKLAAGRRLSPEDALSLDRPWVLAFRSKMASIGFRYQDEGDPFFTNEKNVPMYHLLFFSKDVAGLTIWRGIKKIEPSGQRTLPL